MTTDLTTLTGYGYDDMEASVLGAVLTRPTADRAAELMASLRLDVDDFGGEKNRIVWQAMRQLERESTPIDVVTLEAEIERTGRLEAIGGIAFLADLALRVPTTENALWYAEGVRDRALGRRVLIAISEVLGKYKPLEASGAEVMTDLFAATAGFDAEQPADARTIGDLAKLRAADLERILASDRKASGYPTGVASLDEKLGGWQPGIVSLLAARPGMGKSAAAMSTADACSSAGFGCHVFSLEDTREAYTDRALSRMSSIPAEKIRGCDYEHGQFSRIADAMSNLRQRKGWLVDDRSGISADEIVRAVRRHKRDNATKVVVVDYIQLIRWPRGCKSSHDALTANITSLADAAKQDGIAYVVLSQLNREVEKRQDKRPMLADLRESGSLEERAKCVVALYRGSYYNPSPVEGVDYEPGEPRPDEHDFKTQAQCLVLKNSNGRTGAAMAQWHGATTTLS